MRIAPALGAVTVTASLLLAPSASAAPTASSCVLIADKRGDAAIMDEVDNDPALDFLGISLGSDAKQLTIVMKMSKAAAKSTVHPAGSPKLQTNFTVGGVAYYAAVVSDATVSGYFGVQGRGVNTNLASLRAVIDTAASEVRVTVPLSLLPKTVKAGDYLTGINGRTSFAAATAATPASSVTTGGLGLDVTTLPGHYKLGTKTCVRPGR